MSVFNYILAMWITLAIGIGLIGAAPWLSSRAKGPRHFRSVRTERAIKSEHRAE
jgi:hypothetical protein